MEEKDFQRIEQMIGKALKAEIAGFTEEIKKDFRLQVGILSEDFQHKLQLVGEGHQMLSRALASPGSRRGWKALPRDREERGVASKQSREVALFVGASGSCRRGLHSEKMDRMQSEIHEINNKVTGVAADLSAHRADTESHKRWYMIKEP